jgi:hypothetical protein
MRRFRDRAGREWDVVLGRASWGAHVALFVPAGHEAPVRQADLVASGLEGAMDAFGQIDDGGLQSLLDRSKTREE